MKYKKNNTSYSTINLSKQPILSQKQERVQSGFFILRDNSHSDQSSKSESKKSLISSNESSILNDQLRTFMYDNQIMSPTSKNSQIVLFLPNELHNIIYEFLDYSSIIRVACTSRIMCDFFNNNFSYKLNNSFGNYVTIGNNIDALDKKGVWYPSVVVSTTSTTIRVRFNGFSSKWDEDYDRTSNKIVPFNTNSRAISTSISSAKRVSMFHPPTPTSSNDQLTPTSNSPSIQEPPRWESFLTYSTDNSPQSASTSVSNQLTSLLLPVTAQQIPKLSLNNFEFTHAITVPTASGVTNSTSRPLFAAARRFVPKQHV